MEHEKRRLIDRMLGGFRKFEHFSILRDEQAFRGNVSLLLCFGEITARDGGVIDRFHMDGDDFSVRGVLAEGNGLSRVHEDERFLLTPHCPAGMGQDD